MLPRFVPTVLAFAMMAGCDRSPVAPPATRHMTPPFAASLSMESDAFQSVTGHYEFVGVNTGNDFKYSLSAIRHTDLGVSGEVEERTTFEETGDLVRTMHGTVTCFTIIGNMALIAGIVDRVESFAPGQENLIPGAGFRLVVVDNGNGDDPPDMGSNARFGLPASSQQFCQNGVPFNLEPIQHGNVTVRP
jgi:hypothetical protein